MHRILTAALLLTCAGLVASCGTLSRIVHALGTPPAPPPKRIPKPFRGLVVNVPSAHELLVLTDGHKEVRVRLHGVQPPPAGSSLELEARKELATLVEDVTVNVRPTEPTSGGAITAWVSTTRQSVNRALLRAGLGRCSDAGDASLKEAEGIGRNHRRGLWATGQ